MSIDAGFAGIRSPYMDATRHPFTSGTLARALCVALIAIIAVAVVAAFTGRLSGIRGPLLSNTVSAAEISEGQQLFDHETFGGNGRTCRTCHSSDNGTISPEEVAKRLASNPSDPLFLHDGLDDLVAGTSRIATHATILIERELPPGVVLVDNPSATSVHLARGVPSTVNTPALDPALMHDMRNVELQDQASQAITRHAQATIAPTAEQLDAIAEFQQTNDRFFSSKALNAFARGGPPPRLPEGHTASQKRGREFFGDSPWNPPSKKGVCAPCHSGPMLNTANEFTTDATGAPPGWRAFDILVSSRNVLNNPVHTFAVTDMCKNKVEVSSPDPGIMITGVYNIPMLAQFLPPEDTCILHPAFFADMFKTPQLFGVRHTAPYFHDNSAKTLEDVLQQYVFFFTSNLGFAITDSNILLTQQDIVDIVAFLRLL
jgi:cytochrome c peroxidase